jgi:hypothetical protein
LGGDVGEKTGNAKKEVWWWPLPVPGGGNGDGWTHRETPAHRNGAAVCVSSKRGEREQSGGGVPIAKRHVELVVVVTNPFRRESATVVTHGIGVAPIQRVCGDSHRIPRVTLWICGDTGGCWRRRSPLRRATVLHAFWWP